MQIEQWLKDNKKTRRWLSKKADIQYDRLCRIIRGEEHILLMEAWEIERATNKRVKPADWIDRSWDAWFFITKGKKQ